MSPRFASTDLDRIDITYSQDDIGGNELTLEFHPGPQTKVMRKAKMSFQSGQVKKVIHQYAVEVQTDSKKDLAEDAVVLKLRKAMGANCKFESGEWIDFED